MYRASILLMLLSSHAISVPAMAQQTDAASKQVSPSDKNNGDNHTAAQAVTGQPNYLIAQADELNIDVFENPNISRTVPVRPDGKISLPLLNDIQAAGQTPM